MVGLARKVLFNSYFSFIPGCPVITRLIVPFSPNWHHGCFRRRSFFFYSFIYCFVFFFKDGARSCNGVDADSRNYFLGPGRSHLLEPLAFRRFVI